METLREIPFLFEGMMKFISCQFAVNTVVFGKIKKFLTY